MVSRTCISFLKRVGPPGKVRDSDSKCQTLSSPFVTCSEESIFQFRLSCPAIACSGMNSRNDFVGSIDPPSDPAEIGRQWASLPVSVMVSQKPAAIIVASVAVCLAQISSKSDLACHHFTHSCRKALRKEWHVC